MIVLRDLHFVSWETILAPRLACAFLFGMHFFKNPTHPLPFVFLHQGTSKGLRFTTSIFSQFMYRCHIALIPLCQYCDDSAVLKILPYWRVCRIYSKMTLPYWGFCRIIYIDILCRFLCTSVKDTGGNDHEVKWTQANSFSSDQQDPNLIQLFQQEKRNYIKHGCFALLS